MFPQQKYNTSQLDKHPQMCVEVRRRQMCMNSNIYCFHLQVHICFIFKFSLEDSHYINCSFKAGESEGGNLLTMCSLFCLWHMGFIFQPFFRFLVDMSSWEVSLGRGKQSVLLYLTSSIPATFSAQLCVLKNRTCVPAGEIHSVTTVRSCSRGDVYAHMH